VLLGLSSSGLHTNGYSLARKVLFERLGLALDARPPELGGKTLSEALLEPHRSYLAALWPLITQNRLAGLAHITGGGLVDNLPRILGRTDALIDQGAWTVPPLFRLLVEGGEIDPREAYRVFNMGIGMVLVVEPTEADAVRAELEARGEPVTRLGETVEGTGVVRFRA
jgi:phosphoribosylformylglycinamidine cyclo-ligase